MLKLIAQRSFGPYKRYTPVICNPLTIRSHLLHESSNQNSSESNLLNEEENLVVDRLFKGLISSKRACLAQSITLIESTHPRKRLQAKLLLSKALNHARTKLGNEESKMPSFRIGI